MKFHHLCVQTDNYKESLNFYINILGFDLIQETPNFHNRGYNTWLKLNDIYIELQTNKKGEQLIENNKNIKGLAHFCFWVDDINKKYNEIKHLGFDNFSSKNDSDIYQVTSGKLFKIIAPEGTIIEFRDNIGI